jgi:hypothetical protein
VYLFRQRFYREGTLGRLLEYSGALWAQAEDALVG